MSNDVQYGLIGYPLSHSFSPSYFKRKFEQEHINAQYKALPIERIDLFPSLLDEYPRLQGLNVTIPYKERVIDYLDSVDYAAQQIGAVNCISIKDGIKIGHNTDAKAFEESILPLLKNHHTGALILGTGGASKAVKYALKQIGIDYTTVSRNKVDDNLIYEELTEDLLSKHYIIINTTPLGTYPNISEHPDIPYDLITEKHLLYDLIYNPDKTEFLIRGAANGATVKNGLEMLELQAEASWTIWTS